MSPEQSVIFLDIPVANLSERYSVLMLLRLHKRHLTYALWKPLCHKLRTTQPTYATDDSNKNLNNTSSG